jgi:arylsulfatase A-like enzyme
MRLQRALFGEAVARQPIVTAEPATNGTPGKRAIDDDAARQYKTPLVDGLSQLVEQQNEMLGDAVDEVSDQLQDTLAEADALLAEAKAGNREAIRQANRQPRAGRANSPNVVLLATQRVGESATDSADATPHLTALARAGITVPQVQLPPSGRAAAMAALLTGRQSGADTAMNLPQMLWQAGYATAIVGDCSWAGIGEDDSHGFDEWFGFRDAREADAKYPLNVWASGRQLGIAANKDGQQQIDFDRLVRAEVDSHLQRHRSGRPFALIVSLPPRDVESNDSMVGVIDAALSAHNLAQRTLFAVLDMPAFDTARDAGEAKAKLIARWPGRLPPNHVVETPASIVDVLPTIAEVVSAWKKPNRLDGSSRLSIWRSAANLES